MSSYTVFYYIAEPPLSVAPEDGLRMEGSYVLRELLGRLRTDGDVLGLIDDQDTTLQLLYDAASASYWVEIPVPAEKGSYGADLTFDGVVDLFRQLPDRFEVANFLEFAFQRFGRRG